MSVYKERVFIRLVQRRSATPGEHRRPLTRRWMGEVEQREPGVFEKEKSVSKQDIIHKKYMN